MTKLTRHKFRADFKAKVALESIKNQGTLAQLSQQFDVNVVTISIWNVEADRYPVGVIEAKRAEEGSNPIIDEEKSEEYVAAKLKYLNNEKHSSLTNAHVTSLASQTSRI